LSNIFVSNKINDNLYILGEKLSNDHFYLINAMPLVIGEKKAALIDTGYGADNVRAYVEKLTDLPLVVLNTHADPDHIGGNSYFDEIYMNERDGAMIPWALNREDRLRFIKASVGDNHELYQYIEKKITGSTPFKYKNIDEGDVIDLGGVSLEAVKIPGHTKGSIAYINRRDDVVFTGDSIVRVLWLYLDRCESLESYLNALEHFVERTHGINNLYCGHGLEKLELGFLDELQVCAREILDGAPGELTDTFAGQGYMHTYGGATIIFDKNKVRNAADAVNEES
jgi:glyoxylase-like metal-dependent hydrolase (beta-lactamase superfamily II)